MAPGMVTDFIEALFEQRRSIPQALDDLRAKHRVEKSARLARMIELLEAEITERSKRAALLD